MFFLTSQKVRLESGMNHSKVLVESVAVVLSILEGELLVVDSIASGILLKIIYKLKTPNSPI